MVARRFLVRQGPAAAAEGEAEEHELEYDTDHGIDVLRLQIFSLTSVPPDLQKVRFPPRTPAPPRPIAIAVIQAPLFCSPLLFSDPSACASWPSARRRGGGHRGGGGEGAGDVRRGAREDASGKYRTGLSTDALSVLENHEKEELEELCKSVYLQVDTNLSLPGRLSGSVEWRRARSKLGQADSLSCSSCPVRKCVDTHVSEIYDALSVLCSRLYDKEIPKQKVIEVVDTLKTLILNLKDANFKNRRATLSKTREATAAFDGIHSSKWEEPDGAKGCWLISKMLDGQTCELESYDLMSANDAPERDPMNWVVEGNADGGSTWIAIDARSSELFESRFCRKSFSVDKRYKANAFRFRFLRSRESNANPRFQIGSIDLYGQRQL